MKLKINNKEFEVEVAKTEEEQSKGLQNREELKGDEGMLFIFEEKKDYSFWMKNVPIPLDIIFIDENKVVCVKEGKPFTTDSITCGKPVDKVLELNLNSGVTEGDEIEYLEKYKEGGSVDKPMIVLDEKGKHQFKLEGGERIFSIKHTKQLIKLAKRAVDDDSYIDLADKMLDLIEIQNTQEKQYV